MDDFSEEKRGINKKFVLVLVLGMFVLLRIIWSVSADIDLSSGYWSTSFNESCNTEWTWSSVNYHPPCYPEYDRGGDWTCSGQGEQITMAANNPNGAGGLGQRHWEGDGVNNNSGGITVSFNTPQPELWIRWYMKYEKGFQWNPLSHDKILHIDSLTNQIVVEWYEWNKVRVEAAGLSYASSDGNGWDIIMANGSTDNKGHRKSDGQWHYWEFHLDLTTGTSDIWIDGKLRMHRTGDRYIQQTLSTLLIGSNQRYPSNGRCMAVDYDDIAIATPSYTGFVTDSQGNKMIGPITNNNPPQAYSPSTTIFLDNNATGCSNGDTTYDYSTRSCGSGVYTVYNNLDDFNKNMIAGGTNFIRAGKYYLDQNNWATGSLAINSGGTPSSHTVVTTLPGEEKQAIIYTGAGLDQYNPDNDPGNSNCPADGTSSGDSTCYYPHPAITIGANYVTVKNLKTYGQLIIAGHDILVENCDIGGGGPYYNWGHSIYTHDSHNVTISNCYVHDNPKSGEANTHKAIIQSYRSYDIIYENLKIDNIAEAGVACGDAQNVGYKGSITLRNSFIDGADGGWMGLAQYGEINYFYIHNNIFKDCATGIVAHGEPAVAQYFYSNTFINCDKDIGTWQNPVINAFNNLHYHSQTSQRYYDIQADPISTKLNSDYNLFYSTTGDTAWYNLYHSRATTLAQWQSYSGKDMNSIEKDPGFINPTGNRPADFKRTSYSGDVSGSPYGTVAGAYITGNECIGLLSECNGGTTPGSYCGDNYCNTSDNENCSTCPQDCGSCSNQTQAICGNGIIEQGEQCDDGNTITENCSYGQTSCIVCSSTCQNISGSTSYCGDGVCNAVHENSTTCSLDCSSQQHQCTSGADTSHDGKIETSELISYINQWLQGNATINQVVNVIKEWKWGC